MEYRAYAVFARSQRGGPLYQIGFVEAFSDALAKTYANLTYDEENWFELCVVPLDELRWVIEPQGVSAKGESGRGGAIVEQRAGSAG